MDRFVSKRSSSSQNLAAPALDDVRAERAAIALSVGLSWDEDSPRPAQQAAALGVRPAGAHHDSPRAPAGHPLTAPGLVATRRSHRPAAYARGARFHRNSSSRCSRRARRSRAQLQHIEAPQDSRGPHRPRLVPGHAGPMENRAALGHAAEPVRGPASLPWGVRRHRQEHSLSLEAEHATSRDARQEKHADARRHDTAERAHHARDRRPVLERGHDPRGTFDGLAMSKAWRRQSSAEWAFRAIADLLAEDKVWSTGWRQLCAQSDADFYEAVEEAEELHADGELFARHVAPDPAEEGPPMWAMAEVTDDEGADDAPMPDAPREPELIDMPPALASAPRMSNLERCIALRLVYGAGLR